MTEPAQQSTYLSPSPQPGRPAGEGERSWWESLRHFGLLVGPTQVADIEQRVVEPISERLAYQLRRELSRHEAGTLGDGPFVAWILENLCGFEDHVSGRWQRGGDVPSEFSHRLVTGNTMRPRHLWTGPHGVILPVFFDDTEHRLGLYKSRKRVSDVVQWLRAAGRSLALVTNGRQMRLLYAGLDFHAGCEWDFDQLFEAGIPGPQLEALRRLLTPEQLSPPAEGEDPPLLNSIQAARRGQAELSSTLGERVREAVEYLVQGHGDQLAETDYADQGAEIYRAAVRVVMRMVFILFAESRDLLPRSNPVYTASYGLQALFEDLDRLAARADGRLRHRHGAWPRVLALFRLVYRGSHHQALPLKGYGGDLFAPGETTSSETWRKALHLLETACFESQGGRDLMPDSVVHKMLERLTRTRIKVRQGRSRTWTTVPVDFSDLSSEYIGILYEGLLDYELRQAPADDPVIFLAVGNEPALPLSRLERLSEKQIQDLFENLKDKSASEEVPPEEEAMLEEEEEEEERDEERGARGEEEEEEEDEEPEEVEEEDDLTAAQLRAAAKERAHAWTRKAAEIAGLVKKPRGKPTPEKRAEHERKLERKAASLVRDLFLPGDWYLVRWGGTRKGAGTYYTRPQLAVPLAHRTLEPQCYEGTKDKGRPTTKRADSDSPITPRLPEEILDLKIVDPACGSGTFPLAALRYLTDALYASLHHHGRLEEDDDKTLAVLLGQDRQTDESPTSSLGPRSSALSSELIPSRPDHPDFEPLLRARLKRHVVERCIYGVDIDPLAVELCKLALWIETMDRDLPFTFLDHKIRVGNTLVGCWFDRFQHYPAMAWKREAGDKSHSNGVHYEKGERTQAIKAFCGNTNSNHPHTIRKDLLHLLDQAASGQMSLPIDREAEKAALTHDEALRALGTLHELPIHEADERARRYRTDVLQSPAWKALKQSFDLWCALWFWPADELELVPMPTEFADPPKEALAKVQELASQENLRFFHWELEFPDVFDEPGSGFDAVLGNPPWENLQPNPEEYFSNTDPLFRSYGRLQKLRRQTELFENQELERDWLRYNEFFKAYSNWVSYAAYPFGDVGKEESDNFSLKRGKKNKELHRYWREIRDRVPSYADPRHPFQHQTGRVFTYKLFLEHAYAILADGGRLGLIVPSGIYSDSWSQPLRELFLDECRWEWLFGFENREGIFDIHRSFKFNALIAEKGGGTEEIQTAFMHRRLEGWEEAERHSVPYPREQIVQFSPNSKSILEIQSQRDLEILDTIYSNSVLLGDKGPGTWNLEYKLEFMVNTDAKLFPPRPVWEEKGYRPDEYSRWLLGDWQPRTPTSPAPREAKRVEIPEGVILSRDGESWIHKQSTEDVALPLFEGRMIGQFRSFSAHWVNNTPSRANWRQGACDPRYLMRQEDYRAVFPGLVPAKLGFRDIARTTDTRTMIAAPTPDAPCGNTLGILRGRQTWPLSSALNSFPFDWVARTRMGGTHLNLYIVEELPAPPPSAMSQVAALIIGLVFPHDHFAHLWTTRKKPRQNSWRSFWGCTSHERLRVRSQIDAIVAAIFGLDSHRLQGVLQGCDLPRAEFATSYHEPKGFWRVDKDKDPELRHTVLTLVAFHDLQEKIREHGGDREKGIEAFCNQNNGEGWLLPETLRLADYGLGHDDRADRPQPVASRLGLRFYDWQLEQDPEESWRECELHARNLLGPDGVRKVKEEIEGRHCGALDLRGKDIDGQGNLF